MKKIKLLLLVVASLVMIFSSSHLAIAGTNELFIKVDDANAKKILLSVKKSDTFKKAKKIAISEGYSLTNMTLVSHLKDSDTKIAYFYLKSKGELMEEKPFIAISEDTKSSFIQLFEKNQNGTLHSKLYKDLSLFNEAYINEDGMFERGSYVIINGQKSDLTSMNKSINEEQSDMVNPSFSWSTFWNCVKKYSTSVNQLRAMVMGACYYVCLTGPPGCITCTAINAGISLSHAGYCVKQAW